MSLQTSGNQDTTAGKDSASFVFGYLAVWLILIAYKARLPKAKMATGLYALTTPTNRGNSKEYAHCYYVVNTCPFCVLLDNDNSVALVCLLVLWIEREVH